MMGMVQELERAQLVVKLEDCWCRTLLYADNIVLVADSRMELQTWFKRIDEMEDKFNSRKSKILVVG